MEIGPFTCSICGEASRDICTFCTKDSCPNHLCGRCHRCSDCCTCDVPILGTSESQPIEETPEAPQPEVSAPEEVEV